MSGNFVPGNEYLTPSLRQKAEVRQKVNKEVEVIKNNFNSILYAEKLPEIEVISIDEFDNKFVNKPDLRKDIDDSLYIEKTSYGWKLIIAIARPSALFDINSEIDKQARIQTTSVYYESHVVPMLPFEISNNLASLIYNQTRLGMVSEYHFSKSGILMKSSSYKARVKNIGMMNYNEFTRNLNNSNELFHDQIKNLLEFSRILKSKRKEAVKNFDDAQRNIGYFKKGGTHLASKLIEEYMLFANNHIAKTMLREDKLAIFRNHMPEYIGKECDLEQMLRAEYSAENKGHFALSMGEYLHWTSPIRRYVDLFNHRSFLGEISLDKEESKKDNKIIITTKEHFDLSDYVTKKQIILDEQVAYHNTKYNESKERNKVKYYIRNNKVTEENIESKDDFDLEINIYFNIKNNLEIPDYFIENLEKRFESKIYNKELLYILAFTKNTKLLALFNKYFNPYNMRNSFVEYFNNSEFISKEYNIEFLKSKRVIRKFTHLKSNLSKYLNLKQGKNEKTIRKTMVNYSTGKDSKKLKKNLVINSYFLNKNKIGKIYLTPNDYCYSKTRAFKDLIEFILESDISFLK